MLLGNDVVANRKAQAGSLAGRLRREERLEQLVSVPCRNADTVGAYSDVDRATEILRRYFQTRLETRVVPFALAFRCGVEAVREKIQTNPSDVLGDKFDWRQ